MNPTIFPPAVGKIVGQTDFVWQPVYEKENSESNLLNSD